MQEHFTNIPGDSTLEECGDGSCGGGDGGGGGGGGVELLTGMFLSFPPVQATVHSVLAQSSTYSRLHEAHRIPLTVHQPGGPNPAVNEPKPPIRAVNNQTQSITAELT